MVAFRDGRRWVFQCKRVGRLDLAAAREEISKLRDLPTSDQVDEVCFVVSSNVSASLQKKIRQEWSEPESCHFWAGSELDERVWRYPEVVREFFQVDENHGGPSTRFWRPSFALAAAGVFGAIAALFWLIPWPVAEPRALLIQSPAFPTEEKRMLLLARDHKDRPLEGCRFTYGGFRSLPTDQSGSTQLDLPAGLVAGQQIKLLLVNGPNPGEEWLLTNPMANVPAPNQPVDLVLWPTKLFQQITDAAVATLAPRSGAGSSPSSLPDSLQAVARNHGLTSEQLQEAVRSFGESSSSNRGIAALLSGRFQEAEALLAEVAEKDIRNVVVTLRYLGIAQYQQGRYVEAESTFRKALALRGDDAEILGSLGVLMADFGRATEAERYFRRALEVDKKEFGPDNPIVGLDLRNLAVLLQGAEKDFEAEPLFREVLRIRELHWGPNGLEVGVACVELGQQLHEMNRLPEAASILRRALIIFHQLYGPDERTTVPVCRRYLAVLRGQGLAEPVVRATVKEALGGRVPASCRRGLPRDPAAPPWSDDDTRERQPPGGNFTAPAPPHAPRTPQPP